MARLARAEVFDPSEVAVLHLCARVVRRCFLFGVDPVTGKNHDHRKIWIEDQLRLLAANFGIDLLSMAILSNHFHLILRSRPASQGKSVDSFLSPLTIDEQNDSIGACANQTRQRCSDKGFLSMSIVDYRLKTLAACSPTLRANRRMFTRCEA
jgi:hypothetical protein